MKILLQSEQQKKTVNLRNMPPKKATETAAQLFDKAFNFIDDQRHRDVELTLDRADDLGFSSNPLIQAARAYWCVGRRSEEASTLSRTALKSILAPSPAAAGSALGSPVQINCALQLVAAALEGVYDFEAAAGVLEELLKRNAAAQPQQQVDRFTSEKLVADYALARNFKGMQRMSMELTKQVKGEPRLSVVTVMALLLQVENRRGLSPQAALDCLQYKLALRVLDTAVMTDANTPPPPGAPPVSGAAAASTVAAAKSSGKKKTQAELEKEEQDKRKEQLQKDKELRAKCFLTPSVIHIYVDVLKAQQKYAELLVFLLVNEKGKLFGAWSERVFECAKVLRAAGRIAEANSVARHLWTKVDPDRYDFFEFFRDTALSPAAAPAAAAAFSAPGHAKSEVKLECAPGVHGADALLADVLAVVEHCKQDKHRCKMRTPRLAAISLLSSHTSATGVPVPAAAFAATGKKQQEELRLALIAEHVRAMPSKPLLFFDLVKFVQTSDADTIEHAGSPVLARGYCRREELAADDKKTADFVNLCMAQWKPGKKNTGENSSCGSSNGNNNGHNNNEDESSEVSAAKQETQQRQEEHDESEAVHSDLFVIASCSACIRRSMYLFKQQQNQLAVTWLKYAAAVVEQAVQRFSPHLPHITMLSSLLHSQLHQLTGGLATGNCAVHLKELRIKNMQSESAPFFLNIALRRECQTDAAMDLLLHGSRYHRFLRYDEGGMVRSSITHSAALPAVEDLLFDVSGKVLSSVVRAEMLAFDTLLRACMKEADTGALLRQKLLLQRMEMREDVLFPKLPFNTESAPLLDRKQFFAVALQEDPSSAAFDCTVDFLLLGTLVAAEAAGEEDADQEAAEKETFKALYSQQQRSRLRVAKLVAATLLTLDHISAESLSSKMKARALKQEAVPVEEIDKLLGEMAKDESENNSSKEITMMMWQWISLLAKSASSVFGAEKLDKNAATTEATKLLGIFRDVVQAITDSWTSTTSSSSFYSISSSFIFPVLPLITVATRVICDRQSQGVKAHVALLRAALERLKETMKVASAEFLEKKAAPFCSGDDDASKATAALFSNSAFVKEHGAACLRNVTEMKAREEACVDEAVQTLIMVEKLTR